MITILLDGDWILYTAGFAGQKTRYMYPRGEQYVTAESLTDLKAIIGPGEYDPADVYAHTTVDEPSHIYHSAKKMIQTCVDAVQERFDDVAQVRILIDGDGNFRTRLARIAPYKGNRSPASKPLIYNDLRQYLLDAWRAEVIHDVESDDELTTLLTEHNLRGDKAIIVGVDKDLLQCPGWHFNPNKGFRRIAPQEGNWRLFVQACAGDPTDNIKGAHKIGLTKAQKLILPNMPPDVMWETTVQCYADTIHKYGTDIYGGLNAEEAAYENLRLVYLLRDRNEHPSSQLGRHQIPGVAYGR